MTTTLDWNWFFSSFAQSIAALDGTLIAFIVATLINNQADHSKRLARIGELIRTAERLRDAAGIRYFDWYNERMLSRALGNLSRMVNSEEARRTPEEYAAGLDLPEYLSPADALAAIRSHLNEIDEEARARAEAEEARARRERQRRELGMLGGLSMPEMPPIRSGFDVQTEAMRTEGARRELEEEAETIRRLRVDVLDNIRSIQGALQEVAQHTTPSELVRWVLAAGLTLFLVGVIYPLSFMPVPAGWNGQLDLASFFTILFSLRGAVLSLATIVFTGLLMVLHRANERLRHSKDDVAALTERASEEYYSRHFAVWRARQDALTSRVA